MYVSLYDIVFMYWRHWRDDVCADALLKHFSCIILCRLAFGCLQWYEFTLFSFGFSDFSSRYFFELGNLVIFNDNDLIVYLLIYKINVCNILICI